MDIVSQIAAAVKARGRKKELAEYMGWHQNVVTNILQGNRRIQADELTRLQEFIGSAGVRIVGAVGAGDEMHYYAEGHDPAEVAPAIPEVTAETVAVEIRGQSLGPALDGWLAYYNDRREPVTPDLMGRLCVVGLANGQVLIKILRQARQRGTYHLLPNASGEPMLDQKVEWAARVIDLRPKS